MEQLARKINNSKLQKDNKEKVRIEYIVVQELMYAAVDCTTRHFIELSFQFIRRTKQNLSQGGVTDANKGRVKIR